MRQITVVYRQEDGIWWAESPSVPGFSSAAASISELRKLSHEGIAFALDGEPHMILEVSGGNQVTPAQQVDEAKRLDALVAPVPSFMRNIVRPIRSGQNTNPSLVLA